MGCLCQFSFVLPFLEMSQAICGFDVVEFNVGSGLAREAIMALGPSLIEAFKLGWSKIIDLGSCFT